MQRLSRTDAGFLAAETPEWHMHVGVLAAFDADAATRLGPEQVGLLVTGRLARIGLFRRRVVEMPGRLDRPAWEDVPQIDVDAHLHQATAEPPGDERRLAALSATSSGGRSTGAGHCGSSGASTACTTARSPCCSRSTTRASTASTVPNSHRSCSTSTPTGRSSVPSSRRRPGPGATGAARTSGRPRSRWRRHRYVPHASLPTWRGRHRRLPHRFALSAPGGVTAAVRSTREPAERRARPATRVASRRCRSRTSTRCARRSACP